MVFLKAVFGPIFKRSVGGAKACISFVFSVMADVLFPAYCVGCGVWDEVFCERCRACVLGDSSCAESDFFSLSPRGTASAQSGNGALWRLLVIDQVQSVMVKGQGGDCQVHRKAGGEVGVSQDFGVDVPHWVLAEYAGVARNLVLAAKHRSDVKLEFFLVDAGFELGKRVGESVLSRGWEGRVIRVIPAPSRLRRRLAGREVALPLAVGVAQALSESVGGEVWMQESFRLRWGSGTQAGKSGIQRKRGRIGTMECLRPFVEGEVIVFVDDIVTTGATIREMARALGRVPDAVVSLCGVSLSSTAAL